MLIRYKTSENGKAEKQAEIYQPQEHGITNDSIDPDAFKIARRLRNHGHSAYIVGGAVRDLLLGKHPKDFDLVTDALPGRIRKLFRNSRVIGKRFRLVHIFFRDKIIEVSTFRAREAGGFNNVYGVVEEDVLRRDFTMNALYYCPIDRIVIDYVGGYRDISERKVRPVIPLNRIFVEDPVRMVRALKYAVGTGGKLVGPLRRQVKRERDRLEECSESRMTEEVFKILLSGNAAEVFRQVRKYKLLQYMLPEVSSLLRSTRDYRKRFFRSMERLDDETRARDEMHRSIALAHLCADYLYTLSEFRELRKIPFKEAYIDIKRFIHPVVPANRDVEKALAYLLKRRKRYLQSGGW